MTAFDRSFCKDRWSKVLGDPPARSLAGCGHGSDAIWLASLGWQVTTVDFSATALGHARSTAEAAGADVAERIDWVEDDLANWSPQPGHYDLVACVYA